MQGARKSSGFFIFIVLFGAICGSFIGDIIGTNVKSLIFFKSVYSIGMPKPLILDLRVIIITFGLNFNINLMTIIGVILAIILYRKL